MYIWNIENEGCGFQFVSSVRVHESVRIVGHPDYLSWSPDGKYICVMNDVILSSSVDSRGGLFSSSTQSLVTYYGEIGWKPECYRTFSFVVYP